MESSVGLKRELWEQLLYSIDNDLSECSRKPRVKFEIVSDEREIPEYRGNQVWIVSKIPEPRQVSEDINRTNNIY